MFSSTQSPSSRAASASRLAIEQAVAALRSGNSAEAERSLRTHLLAHPGDAAALAKLAEILLGRREIDEVTVLLRRAAVADRTEQRSLALLRHLQAHAGSAATLDEIDALPAALRSDFEISGIEAAEAGKLGLHDREIAIYEELVKQAPDNAALWKTFGDALKTVGRLEEGIAAVRRAIRIRPTYGEAWWTLANFKAFRFSDDELAAMRKALKKKLGDDDMLHLNFALGKALEDRGLYPQSFRHYSEANRIRASRHAPAEMRVTGFVDLAVSTFTKELFDGHAGGGSAARAPIFIVGLPRSGSTLVEQILASHPLIEGTTEIPVINQMWQRIVREAGRARRNPFEHLAGLGAAGWAELGAEYIERTARFRSTARPFFVDKLPANWMHVGLIRLCLPNARVIDARRNPMACGFSNFRQHYASGVLFSYSFESIGRFYADYLRLMNHFDRVIPGFVHHLVNERLIEDPEREVRNMLEFVGVPFDPACLEFHKTKRAIRTPSAEQVRQPINRAGVDQWRNYEPWLAPLKEALGDVLEQWDRIPG